jgi:hypothetical protein
VDRYLHLPIILKALFLMKHMDDFVFNIVSVYLWPYVCYGIIFCVCKCLVVFPHLDSCNEFAGTPIEASLDGCVKSTAYREYTRSK